MSVSIKKYPFVSICTPTFNRRHFFPILFEMFKLQTYPKNRMEWIIIDDGTDKIHDIIKTSGIKQIKYIDLPHKLSLGEKRNLMHTYCKGSIIIYVDDDDYFPPERVSHSVESLLNAKNGELIAGSSEIYLYFKDKGLYQFGPYGPYHATAGTFAFKRELIEQTKYDNDTSIGEESTFLKNYTIPMIQLDPVKTILVFPHGHNSFDKHTLLDNIRGGPIKPSTDKTVDTFIKGVNASLIKDFFVNKIHDILSNYKPGEPSMKPDVLLQTRQIQIKRNLLELQMQEEIQKQQYNPPTQQQTTIMLMQPDGTSIPLTNEQVCERLTQLEKQLQQYQQQTTIMLMQPDGTSIPLTNEQACKIITEQQKVILEQKEIISKLTNKIDV
jgi:Glycosyl transferase family 2